MKNIVLLVLAFRLKIKQSLPLFFLALGLTSTAYADNLLMNSGFETGNMTGWTVGGTASEYGVGTNGQLLGGGYYAPSAVEVLSGDYAVWGKTAATNGEVLTLSQTLNLGAGLYSAGFYYGSNQGPFGNSTIIFLDGSAIAWGSSYINNGFQLLTGNFELAAAGTHTIQYNLSGSGTAQVAISADNFFLNGSPVAAVPEPETYAMLLAGLGLLGFTARRRKDNAA